MIRHGFDNNSLRKMLSFHKKNSSWTKKETRKVASKRKSTFHSRTTDFSQYPIIYFSQQNSPLLPSSFPFALPIYSPLIITNQSSSPNNKKEQLPYLSLTFRRGQQSAPPSRFKESAAPPPPSSLSVTRFLRARCNENVVTWPRFRKETWRTCPRYRFPITPDTAVARH